MNDPISSLADSPVRASEMENVFIVGAPRSGTTWLQRMISAHPFVAGGPETHFFEGFGPILRKFPSLQPPGAHKSEVGLPAYWTDEMFRGVLIDLWDRTNAQLLAKKPSASTLSEKTPAHAIEIDAITYVLPRARFIHMIRDGRAVSSSLMAAAREPWGRGWAPGSARKAARMWNYHVQGARRYAAALGDRQYIEITYEQLSCDTAGQLKRLFEFLQIGADDAELQGIISANAFEKQKWPQGIEPLAPAGKSGDSSEAGGFFRKGKTDSWKRDLGLLQKLIITFAGRKSLRECGYPLFRGLL